MPVSTRSQIFGNQDDSNPNQRSKSGIGREEAQPGLSLLRNPHHGLKEKMKALTQFYAQQQQQQIALKYPNKADDRRFSTHPSVELLGSKKKEEEESPRRTRTEENGDHGGTVMKENIFQNGGNAKSTVSPNIVAEDLGKWAKGLDLKENVAGLNREGFSCPTMQKGSASTVVRKLSMPTYPSQCEEKTRNLQKTGPEMEPISETCEIGSRILVFVRLRPMNKKEKEAGSRCCVRIPNKRDVYLTEFTNETDYLRLKRLRDRHFTFDASFPDSTTQQEVYATTTTELVEGVLQGRNGSVFCYGATGAGKTYTMLGTLAQPGVMVLAIKDLFSKIRQRSCDGNHLVHLSYLEVYNETVRDLLSPGRPLVLREDKQGIIAAGLTQYRAYSTDEVMALLQQGNQNRTTEPTRANETSSRSHAILQVVAEYKFKDGASIVNRVGKLSLIDLAGSERALATDQRTIRSLEGANINRSLLALSSCINALVEGKKHIPYRNSKLTQLLKDSLGGACNTVMIANISPSNLSLGETQNTLHWADRAKEIRTKACEAKGELLQVPESETDQAKLLLEVQKENRELRMQLARCQRKLLVIQAQSLAACSSPAPSSASSLPSPDCSTRAKGKRRSIRSNIFAAAATANCFNTPEPKKKRSSAAEAEETIRELRQTVRALETDLERIKKEHGLQIKQKNDFICELCLNQKGTAATVTARTTIAAALEEEQDDDDDPKLISPKRVGEKIVKYESERPKRVGILGKQEVNGSNLAPKLARTRNRGGGGGKLLAAGDLKSPSHRFLSPAPTAKKRSYWDITTMNSPSVAVVGGRSTRSHVAAAPDTATAPSMLLQPGFTRQRPMFPNL